MMGQEGLAEDERAGEAGQEGRAAAVIGVLGAGTMGAGIAQLACRAGAQTLLYDAIPEALGMGVERVQRGLRKETSRSAEGAEDSPEVRARAAFERLHPVTDLAALASCELVIEAVPERLELKHELFAQLSEIVAESCVLATNTSSLPVSAIAAAASNPERVVGMHFFNPAPVMRLVEVIAGERSGAQALAIAEATGEAMGKTVIHASDGPGFLVNRCNRPFGLEALRLLQERIADVETIDRVCRIEGGFRMGPFELMDLVGIDTGFEVSKSFFEQSFGEPRWRPSPITARYVAAGLHGRKSGRGFYDYGGEGSSAGPQRPEDPAALEALGPDHGEGVVVISGFGVLADELRAAAKQAGYEVRTTTALSGDVLPALIIDCDCGAPREEDSSAAGGGRAQSGHGARLLLCARGSLGALDPGGSAVGFHVLPPLGKAGLVELTRTESSSPGAAARAER